MHKDDILDYTLVPMGFFIMAVYHIWLLRQIIRRPTTTVVGINAINRRLWTLSMMEDSPKYGILAIQSIRNNIMASTLLATTATMISAAITVMMIGGYSGRGGRPIPLIFGDKSDRSFFLRYFFILVCFMVAFLLSIQSVRYYSHASILIFIPSKTIASYCNHSKSIREEYVCTMVNRGGYFWSLALRAIYFSFPMVSWIFGPIPMLFCCVVMVLLLYFLDFVSGFGGEFCDCVEEEEGKDEEANACRC